MNERWNNGEWTVHWWPLVVTSVATCCDGWFVTSMAIPGCLINSRQCYVWGSFWSFWRTKPSALHNALDSNHSQIACFEKVQIAEIGRQCRPGLLWLGFTEAWGIQCLHAEPCLNSFEPRSCRGCSQLSNTQESSWLVGKPGNKNNILSGTRTCGQPQPEHVRHAGMPWQFAVWVWGLNMFWRRPRRCLGCRDARGHQNSKWWPTISISPKGSMRATVVYRFTYGSLGSILGWWHHQLDGHIWQVVIEHNNCGFFRIEVAERSWYEIDWVSTVPRKIALL